jgi:hypothetical protein
MKGILFTAMIVLIALTLVSLITIQKSLTSHYSERIIIESRIDNMESFYEGIIADSGRALDIITREGAVAAISEIITTGNALENASSTLEELVINGTFDGTAEPLMENSTFPYWIDSMEVLGELKGFNTSIEFENLKIEQYDSWNLLISTDIYININDTQTDASLKRNETINYLSSVEGFEDPIFPLETSGRATNVIEKSPYWNNFTQNLITGSDGNGWFYGLSVVIPSSDQIGIQNVQNKNSKVLVTDSVTGIQSLVNQFGAVVSETGATGISIPYVGNAANAMNVLPNNTNILVDGNNTKVWNIENFKTDVANSYYHPSLKGASFLERLEGKIETEDTSGRVIGLETFVNKTYFSALEIPIHADKTNVDHLYFSNSSYVGNKVKGLNEEFRIDGELCTNDLPHRSIYNVSEILY